MNFARILIYFLVSFLASVGGAICGIGGGVIIKPILDLMGLAGAATISFLSGCTVLAMSGYSVIRNAVTRQSKVDFHTCTFLAIGAAVGGVAGKQMFNAIISTLPDQSRVTSIQSVCLAIITLATFLYTLKKEKIRTHHVTNPISCVVIGLFLGIMSSFLGIGGGPINLVVLFFFYSMDTKTAAQSSLYVILFSQAASFITTLVTCSVPSFSVPALVLMVCGGITGGIIGQRPHKSMDNQKVQKLFLGMMLFIIAISIFNAIRYAGLINI